ncbi:MAG: hypothetical protein HY901_37365 [Deltaproteobacteria bacterium]|nr:hypothetical protein [Deltaproteobacteria bacterium]
MKLLAYAMGCAVALAAVACGGEGRIDDPLRDRVRASSNVMVADGTCIPGAERDCILEEDGTIGIQWCTQERTVRGWTSCDPVPVEEFGARRRDGGAEDPTDPEFGNRRDAGSSDPTDPEFGNRRDAGSSDPTDPEFGNRRDAGSSDPTDPEFGNRRDAGTQPPPAGPDAGAPPPAGRDAGAPPPAGRDAGSTPPPPPPPPPPAVHDCIETEGNACNTDPGYGDRCDSRYNTGGCSEDRFQAWCRRRSANPEIWDNWVYGWVDERCDGEIREDDHNRFTCVEGNQTWTCKTPLVLVFAVGEPVRYLRTPNDFRIDASMASGRVDWPQAATPWLAFDRNNNGRIDDGSELFGSSTVLTSGQRAANGFEALAELDSTGDGKVDGRDQGWSRLLVWRDVDGDGVSQPRELVTARKAGLVDIELAFWTDARCDERGNCERERARFLWQTKSGEKRRGEVVDVHLKVQEPAQAVCMP